MNIIDLFKSQPMLMTKSPPKSRGDICPNALEEAAKAGYSCLHLIDWVNDEITPKWEETTDVAREAARKLVVAFCCGKGPKAKDQTSIYRLKMFSAAARRAYVGHRCSACP